MAKKETAVEVIHVNYSSGAVSLSNGMVYLPLPTTNTIYCDSVYIGDMPARNLGVATILNGILSSANAIVTLEQSFRRPEVEGSQGSVYVAVQTVNMTAVGTWNYVSLLSASNAAIVPFIRFKVASATTSTSATVNVVLMKQVQA